MGPERSRKARKLTRIGFLKREKTMAAERQPYMKEMVAGSYIFYKGSQYGKSYTASPHFTGLLISCQQSLCPRQFSSHSTPLWSPKFIADLFIGASRYAYRRAEFLHTSCFAFHVLKG
jgi:hypothetical protein